jgi:hypothetical protein
MPQQPAIQKLSGEQAATMRSMYQLPTLHDAMSAMFSIMTILPSSDELFTILSLRLDFAFHPHDTQTPRLKWVSTWRYADRPQPPLHSTLEESFRQQWEPIVALSEAIQLRLDWDPRNSIVAFCCDVHGLFSKLPVRFLALSQELSDCAHHRRLPSSLLLPTLECRLSIPDATFIFGCQLLSWNYTIALGSRKPIQVTRGTGSSSSSNGTSPSAPDALLRSTFEAFLPNLKPFFHTATLPELWSAGPTGNGKEVSDTFRIAALLQNRSASFPRQLFRKDLSSDPILIDHRQGCSNNNPGAEFVSDVLRTRLGKLNAAKCVANAGKEQQHDDSSQHYFVLAAVWFPSAPTPSSLTEGAVPFSPPALIKRIASLCGLPPSIAHYGTNHPLARRDTGCIEGGKLSKAEKPSAPSSTKTPQPLKASNLQWDVSRLAVPKSSISDLRRMMTETISSSFQGCNSRNPHGFIPQGVGSIPVSRVMLHRSIVLGQFHSKVFVCLYQGMGNAGSYDDTPAELRGPCLWCFDQHAVHERIRLEYFLSVAHSFVHPHSMGLHCVSLDPELSQFLRASPKLLHALRHWKWDIEFIPTPQPGQDSPQTAQFVSGKVTQVPRIELEGQVYMLNELQSLRSAVEDLSRCGCSSSTVPMCIVDILVSRSCRGAIMFGDRLPVKIGEALLHDAINTQQYAYCSHGRPSMIVLRPFSHPKGALNLQDRSTPKLHSDSNLQSVATARHPPRFL